MKKRLDDRRGHARFEIVGILSGTLEVWQRSKMINFSTGGALIESAVVLDIGKRIEGRVATGAQVREMPSDVCWAVSVRKPTTSKGQYRLGIAWAEPLVENDQLMTMGSRPLSRLPRSPERRRAGRFLPTDTLELSWPSWLTVELIDVSQSGVLIGSPASVPVQERGQLRLRFGERPFVGEIEIRRIDPRPHPRPGIGLGATFTSLDEANRGALCHFIGAGGRYPQPQ